MLGHFARDQIIVDGKQEEASGGGIYYGSMALRRMGLRVAVVTRLHPKDDPYLDELRQEGVIVYAHPAEQTSGIANFYTASDMERRITHPLGFAGPFQLADLPEIEARIYAIVPIIAGEVDLALVSVLAGWGPVALDVQGFVRVRRGDELVFQPWAEMEAGLSLVTYLKLDRAEAELLSGSSDLAEAARALARFGPQEIVITESAGITVYADGALYTAPFTSRVLAGRTGRGDTCFASYLGARLSVPPGEACRISAVITSQKQELPGPWRGGIQAAGLDA
jgi:sugar/nucleoside kinase (ribokinase family)